MPGRYNNNKLSDLLLFCSLLQEVMDLSSREFLWYMSDDGVQPMRSILTGCVELAEKLFKCYDLLIVKTQSGNRIV